jgi:hypothetical protein
MVPAGAITSMQRNTPALLGTSWRSTERTERYVHDLVKESVELSAALTWGELPVQSQVRCPSACTVIATVSGTGSSLNPSLSR